jgi:hypothetical protein
MDSVNNINSAIYKLYSSEKSIIQYRQNIFININDINYIIHKELYEDDDSVYIEMPNIPEITIISDVCLNKDANYEFIADKNIIKNTESILVKKYKKVFIRIYNITSYDSLIISFVVTLTKNNIKSCL